MKAILLMGPTATGKTELALRLSEYYPIEIISVDSALIYREMNIGSAKPNAEELTKVAHHLIDIISPLQSYSVADFIYNAVELIRDITARGKIPILVGGTMMYYSGLLNGISKLPESNEYVRQIIENEAEKFGYPALHAKLQQVDPIAAVKIMPNDKQRLIRALEVYQLTGQPITLLQQENKLDLTNGIEFISLAILPENREILHERINLRFDKMLDLGFIEEVRSIRKNYPELTANYTSMRCVGYAQVWQYLDGLIGYAELAEKSKATTRQLAKRQITWLRGMNNLINITDDRLDIDKLFSNLLQQMNRYYYKK